MTSSLTFHHIVSPLPIDPNLGSMLLAANMFAEGNDFTSEWATDRPDYVGRSLLKPFWEGRDDLYGLEHMKEMELVLIKDQDKVVGVVSWVKPYEKAERAPILSVPEVMSNDRHHPKKQIMSAHLGLMMTYLHKPYRGQGVMKQALRLVLDRLEADAQQAHQEGAFPVLSAVDATAKLLGGLSSVPLIDNITSNPDKMSRSFKSNIWEYRNS